MDDSEAGQELVWLWTLLCELGFGLNLTTPFLCDNSAAVLLCGNQAFHNCIKHLEVRYHWIKEQVENEELIVEQISLLSNIADVLTKALSSPHFISL